MSEIQMQKYNFDLKFSVSLLMLLRYNNALFVKVKIINAIQFAKPWRVLF
jgi:hypothetical protein